MTKHSPHEPRPTAWPAPSGGKGSHRKAVLREVISRAWPPLLLAVVAFVVYLPSLWWQFVGDAGVEIETEGFIPFLSNLPAVLTLKVLHMNLMLGPRPGALLYLMLNAALYGKDPFGYHLSSNLLHAANVALLFVLLRRLLSVELPFFESDRPWRIPLAIGAVTLLFALHPIAVESVSEVSYSSSLLVVFFTLSALLAATAFDPGNFRRALWTGAVGTFCAFAAVTCKESGLAAALLLIVYWFLFRRTEARKRWVVFLSLANGLVVLFLAARFIFAAPNPPHVGFLGGSFFRVFFIQPSLWVFMMGKLIWPTHLSAFYLVHDIDFFPFPAAMTILLAVLFLQAWLAWKSRMAALGMATYWLGLVAVSNFFPLTMPITDRFYYLPLAGVAMQLLALLRLTLESRYLYWLIITPLLAATAPLTLLTISHETVFINQFTFWSESLEAAPHPKIPNSFGDDGMLAEIHNRLGLAFVDQGRIHDALPQFREAVELAPQAADFRVDLGIALGQTRHVDEAMVQFETALKLDSADARAHNYLGLALAQKGRLREAASQFQKAVESKPDYPEAQANLTRAKAALNPRASPGR